MALKPTEFLEAKRVFEKFVLQEVRDFEWEWAQIARQQMAGLDNFATAFESTAAAS